MVQIVATPQQPQPQQHQQWTQHDQTNSQMSNDSAGFWSKLLSSSTKSKPAMKNKPNPQSEQAQIQAMIDQAGLPSFYGKQDAYERKATVNAQWATQMKSANGVNRCVALTLCLVFGMMGAHRGYLGYTKVALSYNFALSVVIFCVCAPLLITPAFGINTFTVIFNTLCTVAFVVILIALNLAVTIDYLLITTGLLKHKIGGLVPWIDTDVKPLNIRIVWTVVTLLAGVGSYFFPYGTAIIVFHIGVCVIGISSKKIMPFIALVIAMVLSVAGIVVKWLELVEFIRSFNAQG
jgi:hypothetical protein